MTIRIWGIFSVAVFALVALCGQGEFTGFPPGIFQSRAALDGGAGATFNAFDPAKKNSHIDLTNTNLTATANSGFASGATTLSVKSASGSQKIYWEMHVDVILSSSTEIGIGNASITFADGDSIQSSLNALAYNGNGLIVYNSAVQGNIQTFNQGDTIGAAIDIGNLKIWFTTNGLTWNNAIISLENPATNTGGIALSPLNGGPYFAGLTFFGGNTEAFTANFGATSYTYVVPVGFGNF